MQEMAARFSYTDAHSFLNSCFSTILLKYLFMLCNIKCWLPEFFEIWDRNDVAYQ